MFSCKFCKIFKITFFRERIRETATDGSHISLLPKLNNNNNKKKKWKEKEQEKEAVGKIHDSNSNDKIVHIF